MGLCQYYRYTNLITASGYASGMHRGTDQVITLYVQIGEGGFGARPYWRGLYWWKRQNTLTFRALKEDNPGLIGEQTRGVSKSQGLLVDKAPTTVVKRLAQGSLRTTRPRRRDGLQGCRGRLFQR